MGILDAIKDAVEDVIDEITDDKKEETKEVEGIGATEEEVEVQTTFNTDGLDVLVESDDCSIENQEEVE